MGELVGIVVVVMAFGSLVVRIVGGVLSLVHEFVC